MWLYNLFKFYSLQSEIEKKADVSKRKSDNINRKMEYIIKIHQERGFDLFLHYVDCDIEQRSGNLTFPKVIIDTGNTICINKIINCWLSINIKINSKNYDGNRHNNAKRFENFKLLLVL